MMARTLDIIDAETLLATPMQKPLFVVDGLIPQGLCLICGTNKVGKSWLMLWLGLCVARGEPLWDIPTERSDVLYLCLEDTMARVQSRLYQLADEAPAELRFATMCGKLGDGLERQITDELIVHPETRLIIIDTLQKIRDTSGATAKGGMYASDYDDMSALKQIADRYGIAIVLVHHLRKMKDSEDPFNEISGSTGITGAADTIMILKRARSEQEAMLLVNGRDVEYQELWLSFENRKWVMLERYFDEDKQQEEIPSLIPRLIEFMSVRTEWSGTATELLSEMNDAETTANVVTKYLGRYALEFLRPAGIEYTTKRTGQKRLIKITKNDGNDTDDGKNHI